MTVAISESGHAPVNGLEMYYEIHGAGKPLILIHGGFGVTGIFARLLPSLTKARRVIAVELQAHGHTSDIARPLSYEWMADDIAALITHLELEHADIFGYSLGGGVALQTAIRHPQVVRKLVVISAPCKRGGWYPEVLAGMASIEAEAMIGSPMHEAYVSVAPKPENWSSLADKTRQLLGKDYDWSKDVEAIEAPTLLVFGDADSVSPVHAAEFFGLLGGGKADAGWDGSDMSNARLAILPATTHYDILSSPVLASVVTPFLDAPMPKREH